jgi:hypothetical protein
VLAFRKRQKLRNQCHCIKIAAAGGWNRVPAGEKSEGERKEVPCGTSVKSGQFGAVMAPDQGRTFPMM